MAEETKVIGNKAKFAERLKQKYPDIDLSEEEALFGRVNQDYDDYDARAADYKQKEEALSNLFARDPRSASFLTAWRKGGDPAIELVRMFGDDFAEALKDPQKQEDLAQASKDYADRVAKEKDFEEQYQKNIDETLATVATLHEEGNSDDDIDAAMEFLVTIMKDGILGKFSRNSIEMAYKAINHDAAVEEAAFEGEVRGRNSKIDEKLRKSSRNDGTANLGSKNGGSSTMQRPELGAIDRYSNSQTIWERGGEKRKSYK